MSRYVAYQRLPHDSNAYHKTTAAPRDMLATWDGCRREARAMLAGRVEMDAGEERTALN